MSVSAPWFSAFGASARSRGWRRNPRRRDQVRGGYSGSGDGAALKIPPQVRSQAPAFKWPLVLVEWVDSSCDASWRSLAKAVADADETWCRRHVTVGYLIRDTPDFVLVAASYAEPDSSASEHVADTMMIPRAAVTSIESLRAANSHPLSQEPS